MLQDPRQASGVIYARMLQTLLSVLYVMHKSDDIRTEAERAGLRRVTAVMDPKHAELLAEDKLSQEDRAKFADLLRQGLVKRMTAQ